MDNTKYFIITIDTEGDNLWQWKGDRPITTENSLFIPRFQELCEYYGFIPTYLCNWEMANDDRFVEYAKLKLEENKCEIGMHLHAWNTPPYFDLPCDDSSGKPYLIEYPDEIIEEKIVNTINLLVSKFDKKPVVHRAGRWAMDGRYFYYLKKHGFIADCSVTPGINWNSNRGRTPGIGGTDYSCNKNEISFIDGLLEVPPTTITSHILFNKAYRDKFSYEQRRRVWMLRPNGENLKQMRYLVDNRKKSKANFLEFMIHSSELMPGGSPKLTNAESIERIYEDTKKIFDKISKNYVGIGLEKYSRMVLKYYEESNPMHYLK